MAVAPGQEQTQLPSCFSLPGEQSVLRFDTALPLTWLQPRLLSPTCCGNAVTSPFYRREDGGWKGGAHSPGTCGQTSARLTVFLCRVWFKKCTTDAGLTCAISHTWVSFYCQKWPFPNLIALLKSIFFFLPL